SWSGVITTQRISPDLPRWLDLGAVFFFSSRRRHTRCYRDWSSDVCSSDLLEYQHVAPLVPAQTYDPKAPAQEFEYTDGRGRVGRSEERRVGKECRFGWLRFHEKKKRER